MFCEDEVLEAAACAVVVIKKKGRNHEKKMRYKNMDKSVTPNHFLRHTVLKAFGRLIVQYLEPSNTLYD
jgi:hypothetical protein